MSKIRFKIFKYYQLLFSFDDVKSISFCAEKKGVLTVLFDHMPIIASIKGSAVFLNFTSDDKKKKRFWIQRGIFSFQNNEAKLVADELKELEKDSN